MKLHRDSKAQIGTMELVLSVAIGLIVLAAIFSLAPVIGDRIDSAVELQEDAAATGTLTFTGNTTDGEWINISDERYEFDTEGNCTFGGGNNCVDVSGGNNTTSQSAALFAAEVGTNSSIVGASADGDGVTLTADTIGSSGNSITTTTNCTMTLGATLTGGTDEGPWADDDIPTGVDIWSDNASLISLVVLVMIISLAIFYIRRMGGGGGGDGGM